MNKISGASTYGKKIIANKLKEVQVSSNQWGYGVVDSRTR